MQKRNIFKRRGKSRLKGYSRLEYFTNCAGYVVFWLWMFVFASLEGSHKIKSEVSAYQKPYVVVQEKETDLNEKQQILSYIVEVFGDDAPDAITIINKCENHAFNPKAENWNRNGSWDAGIFQVNSIHGYTMEQMKDWKQNIDAAKKIFDASGWSAWSCSHVINIKSFWQ